ncbi:hypothetical protein QFZ37_001528 [Chryseobacterium ginsenosidimutans]|uniref:hypothetical protein n=1 Tax=Chryseobacterium ginsenosidimutans TaxID=687846 RepID=UPI002788AB44|nr:hypothetical protein [Chryseobacterium ginsenosidimutans]MDQ0593159.1 hypothetical protein [Chryseobacterium ginsenosidimutans]
MKKNHIKLIIAALIISSSFAVYSCSKDDDETGTIAVVGIAQDPTNFKGDVTNGQVVTLDATKVYVLTGSVKVKDGGKLVIPAGTRIVATAGAASYLLVEQGGQLYANGTVNSPVSFTSSAATSGSWGGLIVCGKAPINTGTSGSSEIGNSPYGGTASADNSGSLTYVRIENAGIDFATGKKFNGLSLFGVGSETKVENIALVNGAEDGIQLYGGTVNVSNIISVGNENDAFVWTDGWIGTGSNIYTKRRTSGAGNTGIKGINNVANPNASPRSNPIIKNVTFIGGTSGESHAITMFSGTSATIDNIVSSGWTTGINIESDLSVAYFNGHKKITNALFNNTTTKVSLKSTAGTNVPVVDTTFTEKTDALGAGNGTASPAWAIGWSSLQ